MNVISKKYSTKEARRCLKGKVVQIVGDSLSKQLYGSMLYILNDTKPESQYFDPQIPKNPQTGGYYNHTFDGATIVREDGIFNPGIAVDQLINPSAFWLFGKGGMFSSSLYIINFFLHNVGQSEEEYLGKIRRVAEYVASYNMSHKMWWKTLGAVRNFNQGPGSWSSYDC